MAPLHKGIGTTMVSSGSKMVINSQQGSLIGWWNFSSIMNNPRTFRDHRNPKDGMLLQMYQLTPHCRGPSLVKPGLPGAQPPATKQFVDPSQRKAINRDAATDFSSTKIEDIFKLTRSARRSRRFIVDCGRLVMWQMANSVTAASAGSNRCQVSVEPLEQSLNRQVVLLRSCTLTKTRLFWLWQHPLALASDHARALMDKDT
jgi:hypothetical protein